MPSHEQKGIERNPGLLTKRSHLAKDIPNEASLLMSMGQRESQDSHLTDQKELKTDGVKLERLVLITPRPIILESEESHLPRPAPEIKSSAAGKRSTPNSLPIEIKSEDGKFDFDKTLIGYYQALRVAEGSNPNKQAHSGSEQRPAVKPIQIQGKLNGTIIGVPTPAPMPLHP